MALDARITIRIRAVGTRNDRGEYVPGAATDYELWADERNAGSSDEETPHGVRIREIRNFTVRWFAELASALINNVSITHSDGSTWNALNIAHSDARRRFIAIECIRTDVP